MKVAPDTVVTLTYRLEIEGGQAPDWFTRPMKARFIYGRERIIPAVEKAIAGRQESETLTVTIPPEQAYGPYDESLINEVPLAKLKYPEKLKVGEFYEEEVTPGRKMFFLVKEIKEDRVVADFNHPAAGKNVQIIVTIDEVRPATGMDLMALQFSQAGSG
ncbi:FKBP-type peptidyl-prolyl cis-trans isomerase [Thermosulfuriphilus sp.]